MNKESHYFTLGHKDHLVKSCLHLSKGVLYLHKYNIRFSTYMLDTVYIHSHSI